MSKQYYPFTGQAYEWPDEHGPSQSQIEWEREQMKNKNLTDERAAEIAASVGCTPEQVRGVWGFAMGASEAGGGNWHCPACAPTAVTFGDLRSGEEFLWPGDVYQNIWVKLDTTRARLLSDGPIINAVPLLAAVERL